MKKLTLIRHAKSDWHSESQTDFDRPLNERGKKAAPLMGKRLSARDNFPDLLICSPAKRTRQTAKKIAKQLAYPENAIELREEIYEATLDTLIELTKELPDQHAHVMLIGHNPGFSEFGEWFTGEAPDWLPTCGLLELELPVANWAAIEQGCATLLLYDFPKRPTEP